jgi:hypothetical protein
MPLNGTSGDDVFINYSLARALEGSAGDDLLQKSPNSG